MGSYGGKQNGEGEKGKGRGGVIGLGAGSVTAITVIQRFDNVYMKFQRHQEFKRAAMNLSMVAIRVRARLVGSQWVPY